MLTYRSVILSLCLLLAASFPAHANEDPELQRILKVHVDAMGGWRAWNKVESIRYIGVITQNDVKYRFCSLKKAPNLVRTTVDIPQKNGNYKMQLVVLHDGENYWQTKKFNGIIDGFKKILDNEKILAIDIDSGIMPFLLQPLSVEFKKSKYSYSRLTEINEETTSIEIIDGENTTIIAKLSNSDMMLKSIVAKYNGHFVTELEYLDFDIVSEIKIPVEIKIKNSNKIESVINIESISLNIGVDNHYFIPKDIDIKP